MQIIENQEFGGERPLYAIHDTELRGIRINPGESSLKHVKHILADGCRFNGKYPFWHAEDFEVRNSVFEPGARAAIWYSRNLLMRDSVVDAPKMFRDMTGITLENVRMTDAKETFWNCSQIRIRASEIDNADYLFMHSSDIDIENYVQHGNYSFQYCRNITIRNAKLYSKDAFWNSENITVEDSLIDGEFLGWHTKNLRLIRCRISGTQPLCYAEGLVLEDCEFDPSCDLAFEYTETEASIKGAVTSIKNPVHGVIACGSVGEVILDEHLLPGSDCRIVTRETNGQNGQ